MNEREVISLMNCENSIVLSVKQGKAIIEDHLEDDSILNNTLENNLEESASWRWICH